MLGHLQSQHTTKLQIFTSWSLSVPTGPIFDLAKYVMQVCPTFIPTQNSTQKPLVVGYEKEGKIPYALVRFHTHLSDRQNHLRNLHLFYKTHKTSRWLIKE